jgi:hypothetical protein
MRYSSAVGTGSRIELQVGHAALTRHAVNHGSSHAARAIGEPAVIVFGIPEVNDRDNDQKSDENSHALCQRIWPVKR